MNEIPENHYYSSYRVRIPLLKLPTESRFKTETDATYKSTTARGASPQVSARLFRAKSNEMNHLLVGKHDGRKSDKPAKRNRFTKAGHIEVKMYQDLYDQYSDCKQQINQGDLSSRGYSRILTRKYKVSDIEKPNPLNYPKLVSFLFNGKPLEKRSRFKMILRNPQNFNVQTINLTRKLYQIT